MLRSLFSGVSGLRNHQIRMDVIGNNISNVNTVAFKSGRVTFKEGFNQLLSGGNRPPGDHGGMNPIQVGLGMQIGSVDTIFSQGNLETTGLNTDIAIQGDSFFIARKGNESFYTRDGNFRVDADGKLVSPANGYAIQGKVAANGVFTNQTIKDIQLPYGQKTPAKATASVKLAGNLDASVPVFAITDPDGVGPMVAGFNADTRAVAANAKSWTQASITVFDSLGTRYDVKTFLYKSAPAQWKWEVNSADLVAQGVPVGTITGGGTFNFNPDGTMTAPALQTITLTPPGAAAMSLAMDPGSGVSGLTYYSGATTAVLRDQDGYMSGTLQSFVVDKIGKVTGSFSNGVNVELAQIALADFNNPAGLMKVGDNMYHESSNSGGPVLGYAQEFSKSTLTSGALEMSNVDLAQEFTAMIIAQRGFQANSKVITTSDELLQELVNLKR